LSFNHLPLGHVNDVNPGAYLKHMNEIENLVIKGKKNTPEWRLAIFYAATALFHSAEDDNKLVS